MNFQDFLATVFAFSFTASHPLLSYKINTTSISISGFSSGGFMTAQLAIAYSNTFQTGCGVFAGGPYDCARNQQEWGACMYNATPSIDLPSKHIHQWSGEVIIDDVENLKRRRVYLQAGTEDDVIGVGPVRQLEKQLEEFVESDEVKFDVLQGAAHAFPTDFDAEGNSACGENSGPYVANCGYDGAGAVLTWLYGELESRREVGCLDGKTLDFDQEGARGLGEKGFVFVPTACEDGSLCRLHVALHGCTQGYDQTGLQYIENTGYREWAATVDHSLHQVWNGSYGDNANGCFDWIGWSGENADQKGGPQMQAIVNMVERLGGHEHVNRRRDEI